MSNKPKRRNIQWKRLAIVAVACVLVVALVSTAFSFVMKGCSKKEEPKTEETTAQPVTIGEKTAASQAINLENQTGQAIISFKVRKYKEGDYTGNLLGDQRIKNKATAIWNFTPEAGAEYDVEITLANYTQFTLKVWPFDQFSGLVTILYKDGTGYLEYKPKGSDNNVNTYQDELDADQKREEREQQEQAEKEAREREKQEQEEAARQAQQQAEEPVAEEPVYEEPVYEEQPVYEEPEYYYDEDGNAFYYDESGSIIYI